MIENKLEAFSVIETNIGPRIAFKYATIDTEKGTVDTENRGNVAIVLDEDIKNHIQAIEDYILKCIK